MEKLTPDGTAGDTVHDVAAPPAFEGVSVAIAEFTVPLIEAGEYEIDGALGEAADTAIVTLKLDEPVALVAVTVYELDADVVVGVPEMIPVLVEKLNPVGTDGEIDQLATAPPEFVGLKEVIATFTVPEMDVGE